jgi:hypothetical protein
MTIRALMMSAVAAALLAVAPAYGQQPAPEGQNSSDVPTFTTEDVAPAQEIAPEEETPPEEIDPSMTPEERADAEGLPAEEGSSPGRGKAAKKIDPAEAQWRQEYAAAQSRERAATRNAQEAEIAVTRLRNRLASATSVEERNALAEQAEQLGARASSLKRTAELAKAELDSLAARGRAQKFTRAAGPSPRLENGSVNPAYVRDRFTKARDALADSERRIELFQFRVSDLRTRITINSGSGDNYVQSRLQTELDEASRELARAQADRMKAAESVSAAERAAANAGVALPRQ